MPKCRKKKKIYILLLLLTVIIIFIINFIKSLNEAVIVFAESDMKNELTKIINEAMTEVIKEQSVSYDDITDLRYDRNGNVKSVKINTANLNTLKSAILLKTMNKVTELSYKKYGLPLGNLLKSNISSGKGPRIKIKIIPLGAVSGDTRNEFLASGINQTVHRIMLDITASISVLSPFYDASVDLRTSVCISETVIIGNVPDAYFNYTEK